MTEATPTPEAPTPVAEAVVAEEQTAQSELEKVNNQVTALEAQKLSLEQKANEDEGVVDQETAIANQDAINDVETMLDDAAIEVEAAQLKVENIKLRKEEALPVQDINEELIVTDLKKEEVPYQGARVRKRKGDFSSRDFEPTTDLTVVTDTIEDGTEVTRDNNIPNITQQFINDTVETMPHYIKDNFKPFKLRRTGEDRDAIRNEVKANLDVITTAQNLFNVATRGKINVSEIEYLQNLFEDEQKFIDNIINESIVTTNDAQREEQARITWQKIGTLSPEKIVGLVWASGFNGWHMTRLAEKFRSYRPFARLSLSVREAREKYNNIGTRLAESLYRNTDQKEVQKLSKVTILLDAFYNSRPS